MTNAAAGAVADYAPDVLRHNRGWARRVHIRGRQKMWSESQRVSGMAGLNYAFLHQNRAGVFRLSPIRSAGPYIRLQS